MRKQFSNNKDQLTILSREKVIFHTKVSVIVFEQAAQIIDVNEYLSFLNCI